MAKKNKTATFLVELPLVVDEGSARRIRAHLEAARQLYNAILSEGLRRLRQMRADPAWQAARALPRSQKHARKQAFAALREQYGFSEYALHAAAKTLRVSWLAEHVASTMAQALATRAYQSLHRVCVGNARRVRFKSKGRGLDSVEGKRNDPGLRFVLQTPEEGHQGFVLWETDRLPTLIKWDDPVVAYSLKQRVKYIRLISRNASSPQARGADRTNHRYVVQLILEGRLYLKPKNQPGTDILGLDIGPSTLASVGRQGPAQLQVFCEELQPHVRHTRRLQRKLDRQRRANNPQNYDAQGRIKRQGKQRLQWHDSHHSQETRRRLATSARKQAAHRKSLHGRLVNELIRQGNHMQIEHTSFKGWQRRYGKSVGRRAPGMFVEHLRRTVAKTGGILSEISASHTRLSQYCHGCGRYVKKPLSQRWHQCTCGIGPIQRDLYSACLLAFLNPTESVPSIAQSDWARVESRVMAAMEDLIQRAKAGHSLPQSFGLTRARVRQPESRAPNRLEPADLLVRTPLEALGLAQEPLLLSLREIQKQALVTYQKALERSSNNFSLLIGRAKILKKLLRYKEANEDYRKARLHTPEPFYEVICILEQENLEQIAQAQARLEAAGKTISDDAIQAEIHLMKEEKQLAAHKATLRASPLFQPVCQLMQEQPRWRGTPKQLKELLCARFPDALAQLRMAPYRYAKELMKIAPELRCEGIEVNIPPRTTETTLLKAAEVEKEEG